MLRSEEPYDSCFSPGIGILIREDKMASACGTYVGEETRVQG